MRFRLSTLFLLLLVFAVGFFAGSQTQKYRDSSYDVFIDSNKHVGATEAWLIQQFGKPLSDLAGYQALAMQTPDSLPTGKIRTLRFRDRNGTLWVWLEERGGQWGCFESYWFADGTEF